MTGTTTTIPESVYELPSDFNWEPQAVCDYINDQWDTADDDEKCTLFDLAEGLYWYCVHWHGGQWSDEYSIMSSQLDFSPGHIAKANDGPEQDSDGEIVYHNLIHHNQPGEDTE